MLHLRAICPPQITEQFIDELSVLQGVAQVCVSKGGARKPPGDVVQAEVAREEANRVVELLEHFDIERVGGATLQPIETVLSQAAYAAEARAPGEPGDAVVWAELFARTREDSTLSLTYLAFLSIACLLAVVGIVTDSPVTIVGAMVVGPEFGPLAALSVALIRRKIPLARRSAIALFAGFPVAMLVTLIGAKVWELFGWIDPEAITGKHQVDFIYQVGPFSLVVALLAGAAGMLALVTARSAALVGVFISVTTVPAAGYAVVAASLGRWQQAIESTFQLGVNLVGIVVAGVLVLWLRPSQDGVLWKLRNRWRK